ncbi:leucine-rich repeat domain-containing protein [uncultured Bacteroides sp.]|uniref:leucine-rich repeat domain-containing protein n=1 Tax=uncultured Bacteroides sp. TaxID=162156 RepID=UPI002AAA6D09|nr:leucine-rich repeat domain-containing protein [uncultured Bacteroides sp.]
MKTNTICKHIFVMFCLIQSFSLKAQEVPPVIMHVETAGTLPSLISSTEKDLITNLTLSGNLNGTDINFIREMAGRDYKDNITTGKLTKVNLADATIVAGGDYYIFLYEFNYLNYTKNNAISSSMFLDLSNLTTLILPKNITYIGSNAFKGCTGLTSLTIPSGVATIDLNAFYDCSGLTSITIPDGVTSIGGSAFYGCIGLTSIAIPTTISSISENTFEKCKGLTSITIPNNVKSIACGAFYDCTELTSAILPNTISSIACSAFYNCKKLASIEIPNSVTSIEESTFSGCSGLTSITIPNNVTYIGQGAFSYCTGLTSINIGSGVTTIEDQTFAGCSALKEFVVAESNTTYTSFESVLFNKNKDQLFAYPNAKSKVYTIPNSVTSIGESAFYNCKGLTTVIIPSTVTSIGQNAFYGCTALLEMHSKALTPPNATPTILPESIKASCKLVNNRTLTSTDTASSIFYGIDKSICKLYVPQGATAAYRNTEGWSDFTYIIEEESTSIIQTKANNIKVYVDKNAIVVKGLDLGDEIFIYNELGALQQSTKVTDDITRINVATGHIYLVKTIAKTFKLAL